MYETTEQTVLNYIRETPNECSNIISNDLGMKRQTLCKLLISLKKKKKITTQKMKKSYQERTNDVYFIADGEGKKLSRSQCQLNNSVVYEKCCKECMYYSIKCGENLFGNKASSSRIFSSLNF